MDGEKVLARFSVYVKELIGLKEEWDKTGRTDQSVNGTNIEELIEVARRLEDDARRSASSLAGPRNIECFLATTEIAGVTGLGCFFGPGNPHNTSAFLDISFEHPCILYYHFLSDLVSSLEVNGVFDNGGRLNVYVHLEKHRSSDKCGNRQFSEEVREIDLSDYRCWHLREPFVEVIEEHGDSEGMRVAEIMAREKAIQLLLKKATGEMKTRGMVRSISVPDNIKGYRMSIRKNDRIIQNSNPC